MSSSGPPYDYRRERAIAGIAFTALIVGIVGYDALDPGFAVDPIVLAQLVGGLLGVLGLGALLRRRNGSE